MKKLIKSRLLLGTVFTFISLVLLILPNVVWFYLNRETYFEHGTTKLSMGAMLTLLYILAMLKGAFKDIDKRFSTLISMFVFLSIIWFLDSILDDLYWIVLSGIIGYIMYLGFAVVAKRHLTYHKNYRSETARIQARREANTSYNDEGLGSV